MKSLTFPLLCPNGTACLAEDNEEGKKSKKRCQPCGCRVNSQCFKSLNEVLCDCSNSGYTGINCETKIETCNVDDGWAEFEGGCYLFVPSLSSSVDWYSAKSDCQSKGAYLVEITTEAEQDFVKSLAINISVGQLWTGLTDIITETQFVWDSSGQTHTLGYIYGNTDSYDCVRFEDFGGWWLKATGCSSSVVAYVCEK